MFFNIKGQRKYMQRIILLILAGLFAVGDKVSLKNEPTKIGQIIDVHNPHGHHTQFHYLVNWEAGRDSGYSQFLYEYLLNNK